MPERTIGEIAIDRIIESEGPDVAPTHLIPEATPENLAPHRHWLEPHILDPVTGNLVLAIQSYLIRTEHHTILIDTCVGNDKERDFIADWNMRSSMKYINDLAAHGLTPADIDFVMCTHMHSDHVGWNTRLIDGRWVPTFPNARYVFARTEWEFWEQKNRKKPNFSGGCIDDSVLPVIEAGLADMVDSDYAIDDQVWLEPSPGHTPGHVSIRLASQGQNAVMCGDAIHSPVQCAHPEWNASACFDPEQSRRTRRGLLEGVCDTDTLLMTAHFPSPSMGHVVPEGNAFRFVPVDGGYTGSSR